MRERIANCHKNWSLKGIYDSIPFFAETGFTALLIHPIQKHKENGIEWYWCYQVLGYEIEDKEMLIDICKRAHEYGMKVLFDIVLDHFGGADDNNLFPSHLADKDLTSNGAYWLDPIEHSNNERWQMTHRCYGLPRLNYGHKHVLSRYASFIDELMEFGDGVRIDMAQHFELPWEYGENNQFWNMIREHVQDKGKECLGEFINQDRRTLDNYTQYTDCLLLDQIGGKPSDISKAVMAIENHDSCWSKDLGQFTSSISNDEIMRMYDDLCGRYERTMFFCRPWFDIFSDKMKQANYKKLGDFK